QPLISQGLLLPRRIIHILDVKLTQPMPSALRTGLIDLSKLTDEDSQRPAVAYDVVHHRQQPVSLLAQPHQPEPVERASLKIERSPRLLSRQRFDLFLLPVRRRSLKIDDLQ